MPDFDLDAETEREAARERFIRRHGEEYVGQREDELMEVEEPNEQDQD